MQISYLGLSCFKIQTKNLSLIIDPYSSQIGFKFPRLKADIVLSTHNHPGHNNISAIKGEPYIISGPGEYEIKGIFIQGILTFHDKKEGAQLGINTIYLFKIEEIWLAHLGDLGHKLDDKQLEKLEEVDILFLPVGGKSMLGPKEANEVLNEIEPKIVIPMHYHLKGLKYKYETLNSFLKESGLKASEVKNNLKIKKKNLDPTALNLIVFKF